MSPTHILMCRKIPNLPRKLDAQNCEFHGKKLRIRWTKLRTNFFAVNLFFTLQHIFACQRNFYRCDLELFRYNLSLPLLVSSCFSALLNHFVWCNSCVKKSVISMISIFFHFRLQIHINQECVVRPWTTHRVRNLCHHRSILILPKRK